MFILTLMLYCTSKSCKIQVAKVATKRKFLISRQREKASRIGNRIGRNFEPCVWSLNWLLKTYQKDSLHWDMFLFISDIGFEIPDKFVVGYALVSVST